MLNVIFDSLKSKLTEINDKNICG